MVELVVRLVFSLAVVLGLLWLCVRLAGRRFGSRSDAMVRVLHRQSISRNAAVTVISVGSRVLVLGATDQQVQVLAELDPAEVGEDIDLAADVEPEARSDRRGDVERGGRRAAAPELRQQVVRPEDAHVLDVVAEPPSADAVASARLSAAIAGALAAIPDRSPAATRLGVDGLQLVGGRRRAEVEPDSAPETDIVGRRARLVPVPAPSAPVVQDVSVAGELLAQLELFDELATAAGPRPSGKDDTTAPAGVAAARPGRRGAVAPAQGRLTGSVLAPQTWRQAWGAMTGRAS